MSIRKRSSRTLSLAVAVLIGSAVLAAWLGRGQPASAFTVNAPNLPQMTGNPSTSPNTPSPSLSPGSAQSASAAAGKKAGKGSVTAAPTSIPAPGAEGPTAPAVAPSSNWPLVILLSVCGVGVILIGLFFWTRREE